MTEEASSIPPKNKMTPRIGWGNRRIGPSGGRGLLGKATYRKREQSAPVVEKPESVLADRRAQHIPAQLLEPRAVGGGHGDIGVEVEAVEMRVARGAREHPGGVWLLPDSPHAGACAASQRHASLD